MNKIKTNWFIIGSFRRSCMIVLSYLLGLIFLSTSFFGAAYLYWFGGETANNYWETQRFQTKFSSQLKKAAPAVKEYLLQDIQEDHEMVEIYTLEPEDNNGKKRNRWQKTASYTYESGAEIIGISTNFHNKKSDPQAFYEKKNDSFLYDNYNFNTMEENFMTRWESLYEKRKIQGIHKYLAVSSQTMKEWMLYFDEYPSDFDPFMDNVPHDARYVLCNYHNGKGSSTALCYSPKQDRWYYLNLDEDDFDVEKFSFRMPDTVYFPLYGSTENFKKKKVKKEPAFQLFHGTDLYIQTGKVFNTSYDTAIEDDILYIAPFFNLKTVLYEAGKEYYQQKSLLRYIDKKMAGYLWNFTFENNPNNKVELGSREGMNDFNQKKWVFHVNFEEEAESILQESESWLASFAAIGKQHGDQSMTIEVALPKFSLKETLFSTEGNMTEREMIRSHLENFVFIYGIMCVGFAIVCFFVWLYLIIRLLFGKENVVFSGKNQKKLFSFDHLPIEVWLIIFIGSILFLCLLDDSFYEFTFPFIFKLALLFFNVTFIYSLFYAMSSSLIRLIRGNMLWKKCFIIRVWKKCKKNYQDFVKNIWCDLSYKRKTMFLSFAYIVGSIICGSLGFLLLRVCLYSSEYLLFLLIAIVLFLLLQKRAISYVIGNELGKERIVKGIRKLSQGNLESGINTKNLSGDYLEIAQLLPKIQGGLNKAVQKSIRDERMKTELITNVSHDIKTPLTSIINYIDLLKRSKPQGENVDHYLEVLTQKSQRLKQLIEDLVEASKASSGALPLENRNLDLTELMQQAEGEFQEKLAQKNLQILVHFPQPPVTIFADGRRMFRILENLLQNVYKYAMEGTRVYFDLEVIEGKRAMMTLRNISAAPLNITEEELTERFVRGEESRTTEGSGLGLSIAKDLARLQGGEFALKIDGDLFKVVLIFPIVEMNE